MKNVVIFLPPRGKKMPYDRNVKHKGKGVESCE